jgi:hypothetical protein
MAKKQDIETQNTEVAETTKPQMSLVERFFDMLLGVMSLKVQSIKVHQALDVHGTTKSTVDCEQLKCQMYMCPFGVILVSKHPKHGVPFKRLITFNNMYEVHFTV